MTFLWSLLSVTGSIFLTPFLMFFLAIIFLASIGKSLGVRRLYVTILIKVFEYGRQHIEIAKKSKYKEEEEQLDQLINKKIECPEQSSSAKEAKVKNGVVADNTVIKRDDLILVPDPDQYYGDGKSASHGIPRRRSFETLQREFELADLLDYVKAGVEAIIEDEVTQRFEAEELKSWNLLTRTNRRYEFISWRLTIIWMFGFCMRYFFLLPLRVLICFIGVMWMVFSTAILSLVPNGFIKRWLNKRAFLITFRILARSLSTVLTFHNIQYRPNSGGVCVANHTTPIDVVILSNESVFSLVSLMGIFIAQGISFDCAWYVCVCCICDVQNWVMFSFKIGIKITNVLSKKWKLS